MNKTTSKNKSAGIDYNDKIANDIISPTLKTDKSFFYIVGALGFLVAAGLIVWINQIINGLTVTGMNNSVNWGVYIINFVFFIGISHAGTLISAVLRVTNAEWRRPITRASEAITVIALILGGMQIIFDLGRPGRILNVLFNGRIGSPMVWDVICISVYLLSCLFFLLLPLIPDIGMLKENENIQGWRKKIYRFLSSGWTNTPEQKKRLEKVLGFVAILIIPIMISVHTVVSWIFGMTVRSMWHSTIIGPYFVVGAIFSGVASVIVVLAILRKVYHLEEYIKPVHFNNLGILLTAMASLWFYFTIAEYLTTGYGALTEELSVMNSKLTGSFSIIFWCMMICMTTAFGFLVFRKKSIIKATTIASVFIMLGMWLERFTIIVPTLTHSLEEGYKGGIYYPTVTEIIITISSFAGFVLLYLLFAKTFPVISIWEMKEAKEGVVSGTKRMESYLPGKQQIISPANNYSGEKQ